MISPKPAPVRAASFDPAAMTLTNARRILADFVFSGWFLAELAYVPALYVFAFRYPFDTPFFFETANWGLSLLTICATVLLVGRAMRPAMYRYGSEQAARQAYIAGLALAAAALRLIVYIWLLALVLLSQHLLDATPGALLAGSLGLVANSIVLAALTLALSTTFAPRLARLLMMGWLVGALYSYIGTNTLADFFLSWRLPLLPIFAGFTMGLTGTIDGGDLLVLAVDALYVVGLVWLASFWRVRREAARAEAVAAGSGKTPAAPSLSGVERPAPARAAYREQPQGRPGLVAQTREQTGRRPPARKRTPSRKRPAR